MQVVSKYKILLNGKANSAKKEFFTQMQQGFLDVTRQLERICQISCKIDENKETFYRDFPQIDEEHKSNEQPQLNKQEV